MNGKLKTKLEAEAPEVDTDKAYREFLNEMYNDGLRGLGGPFACMDAGAIIEEHSPTDYRCGFADWIDGETRRRGGWVTIDNGSTYHERDKCEELRDELADELEKEADEVREELAEIQNMDGAPHHVADSDEAKEWGRLEAKLEALTTEIEEIKDEDFD